MVAHQSPDRGIPSSTLAALRGILVSSLSRENLSSIDRYSTSRRRVTFHETSGAAPTGDALRHSRPSSVNKGRRRVRPMSMDATPINAHTMHWFAYLGPEPVAEQQQAQLSAEQQGQPDAAASADGQLSDGENEG
ncbi:uncharacterized protein LOC113378096 isoform X2 [Ctenocephalides felis]|uniref:uncharacterized protein LOC113378096 isoform X2 n=1 Tax=Ctenocephalides felis TaxID=7515 RepID=UPI000E6E168D|nr:uncharacterized protein LOC113378096 isoform X2 [Ctenocephalides felis]XP_026474399.1 uncharacterized protein LOC113378096 isoform X2 [Ctenocephalides felis]